MDRARWYQTVMTIGRLLLFLRAEDLFVRKAFGPQRADTPLADLPSVDLLTPERPATPRAGRCFIGMLRLSVLVHSVTRPFNWQADARL
jgi:hypothetical protein